MVVDNQSLGEVDSFDHSQVFIKRCITLVRDALSMLAEEAMLDESARRIDPVNDRVGVPVIASREDCDLVVHVGSA